MASPVDAARTGTNIITAATSHAINVGSPSAGDLLIVYVRFAGAAGTVTFTGYTLLALDISDASDDETYLFYRKADGTEGATATLTCSSSQKLAAICWRITGAADPTVTPLYLSGVTVGTAANINPGAVTPGTIDFRLITGNTSSIQGGGTSSAAVAQSFTALSGSLTAIGMVVAKVGSPADSLVIEIQSNSGGVPSGTVLASVATIAGSALTTTATYTEQSVSLSGLTVGGLYWIVLRRSNSTQDLTNYYTSPRGNVDVYPGGTRASYTPWTAQSANDLPFCVVASLPTNDYLFFTMIGMDHETATATAPTGYSNTANANSGTAGAVATNCMIWGASKQATSVSSDDPAAWTSTAPTTGVTAWTIAVAPPATAVTSLLVPGNRSSRSGALPQRILR